ncbi:head completion/stabilization protein [Ewingella sp. S1.OA.A_B6]
MSLVISEPNPPAAAEPTIGNSFFWPAISPADLRDTLRLEGTVTPKRLRAVAVRAMTEVNAELHDYRAAQMACGFNTLADVPADDIDGESVKTGAYFNAVASMTAANLAERYPGNDTTDKGSQKAEIVERTVDELWRDARNAIHDVAGVAHAIIGLI